MTQDELGLSGRGDPDVADAENTPVEDIRRELDRRGVNYRTPPGFKARIDAFRQKVAEDRTRIADDCPFDLTDEDRREIAEIERMPIEEIRGELDQRGVVHRSGAIVVRRLVRPRTVRLGWRDCVQPQAWLVSQQAWRDVAKWAAMLAFILLSAYLCLEPDDSQSGATITADHHANCGPALADVGGPHICRPAEPHHAPPRRDAPEQPNN